MMEFFTLTLVGLLMIISPGPDFAIVTKISIIQGRLSGLGAAAGIASANLCHVLLNLLGIGMVIASSTVVFTFLKVMGALYLLYIGFKGLRAKPTLDRMESKPTDTVDSLSDPLLRGNIEASSNKKNENSLGLKGYYSGFVTSLLNPKACLFYLSFFSVLLSPATPKFTQLLYGLWICFLALVWFILVAFFFTNPIMVPN